APADSRVTIARAGEPPRVTSETSLSLPEGTYTLTARAPNHSEKTVTVQLAAGESKAVDLSLIREKTSSPVDAQRHGMADWDDRAGWAREGNWFVHKGGNFVLYRATPASGSFVFTGWLKKGRRLQWFVDRTDEKNYALFQMDKKFFYRNQVVNGKQT